MLDIILSAPSENLASRINNRVNAGDVVAVGDVPSFVGAIEGLLDNPAGRTTLGNNGRALAEETFNIGKVAGRFGAIISSVRASQPPQS
jgi:colanic acid biosynthesis glycosyl transferase WcaI